MFEKWAVAAANKIKEANPDETAPHDVLVFGFTILFNLFFTFFILLLLGFLFHIPFLVVQIFFSFIIVRILTGGSHFDQSLACSFVSIIFILLIIWLPISFASICLYFVLTVILILKYAPYYEAHQVVHSKAWEQKKKMFALLWVTFTFIFYFLTGLYGFVLGAILQALLLTPVSISVTHKLNTIFQKRW